MRGVDGRDTPSLVFRHLPARRKDVNQCLEFGGGGGSSVGGAGGGGRALCVSICVCVSLCV